MRLIIGIIVFVPCAIILGVFAVENRQILALELWPITGAIELSASLWLLLALVAGLLAGLGIGWISTIIWCRRARKAERLNRALELKLEGLVYPPVTLSKAESSIDRASPVLRPQAHSSRVALIED